MKTYHREDLPPDVALILAAYRVNREDLTDRFIVICNQSRLDGLAIYEELHKLCIRGKCDADLADPKEKLTILHLINKKPKD